MKKNKFKFFGIVALIVTIGFTMAACGEPGSDPGGTTPTGGPIVISGTIGGGGGAPSPNIVSRSVMPEPSSDIKRFTGTVQSDNTIVGVLEDGDMMFKLTGVYDPQSKAFSMQAASSMMVFALTGKLDNSNTIDASESTAAVHIKDTDTGHWTTHDLGSLSSSSTTVSGEANQEEKETMPSWTKGIWYDQFTGLIIAVTDNAISLSDGATVVPMNILDIETKSEVTGSRAIEVITRAVFLDEDMGIEPIHYTSRFYVAESWDSTLSNAIGSVKLNDMFDFIEGEIGQKTLTVAETEMKGTRVFIAPYISNAGSGVNKEEIVIDGYSPMFTADAAGTAAAKAATKLGAIPTFMMALQHTMNTYFVPEPGKLTITGLDDLNGYYVTASYSDFFSGVDMQAYLGNSHFGGLPEGAKIANGQVTLSVYRNGMGYSGSGTFTSFTVYVSSKATTSYDVLGDIEIGSIKNVSFTNGKAEAVFTGAPRITITGIPSTYNNRYVMATANVNDTYIEAGQQTNMGMNGVQVKNGSVTLKVAAYDQLYTQEMIKDDKGEPVLGKDGFPTWKQVLKVNPTFFDGNGKVKFEVSVSSSAIDPRTNPMNVLEKGSAEITLTGFAGTGTYKAPPFITIDRFDYYNTNLNGKYVTATAWWGDNHSLIAYGNTMTYTAGQIQNGQVKLQVLDTGSNPFNGNGEVLFTVQVYNSASSMDPIEGAIVSVWFSNFEQIGVAQYKSPVKITITGLSAYNGKYINGSASETIYHPYLTATAGGIGTNYTPIKIQNGTATLNVYSGYRAESNFTPERMDYIFRFSLYEKNDGTVDPFSQTDDIKVMFANDGVGNAVYVQAP